MRQIQSIAAVLVACLGWMTAQPTFAQPAAATIEVSLPAQPLDASLKALADRHKIQILFSPADVRGIAAPEVKGRYTVDAVLQKLTAGTNLSYSFNGQDTVVVRSKMAERAGASGGASSAGPILAQAGSSASSVHRAESITVTAQKRSELLIDVPQSVTVLSADDLAKTGIVQMRDFANTVPGLSFVTTGAFTQVSLRGVTIGADIGPTVGIYVDEVPYGSSSAFAGATQLALDVGLFDLDRIEVLRGPQGTLYGASTMGGLIKYVTKRPDPTRFGIEARSGISNTQGGGVSYYGAAAVNAPIAPDRMAVRAGAFFSRDGGYVDNLTLGQKDVNRSDVYGGRADLLFMPTNALSVRITGFLQNIYRDGEGTVDYTFTGTPLHGSLEQRRLLAEPSDQRFRLVSGTATLDLGPTVVTSISSYQTVRSEFDFDLSANLVPVLALCPPFCRTFSAVGAPTSWSTDKFAQEVRLASEKQALEWLIGGFYTHEESELRQQLAARDVGGQLAPNDLLTHLARSRYEEYAAFGDLTWHLTDKFDVTAGVRYARNRNRFEQIGSGVLGASRPETRSTEDVFTYLANARYHFSDHAIGYLRYATGYRPGGPNIVAIDPTTGLRIGSPTFESDRLKSYEIGFKTETTDRRFGLDAAGYYIDWSNIQIAVVRGGFGVFSNAPGGATVRGAELALTARPVRGLTLTGAFAYQDAEMAEADTDLGASQGERLPNVPRYTVALNADYAFALGRLQPSVGATVRFVDDRTVSFDRSTSRPQYQLPDYATVDLRAGVTVAQFDVRLYVRNLLDERGQLSTGFTNERTRRRISILQPRTIGVTVSMTF